MSAARTAICFVIALTVSPAFAGPLDDGIDAVFEETGITESSPGAAVLVIQNGEVIFEKCYGLSNLQRRTRIRRETTFELASMSKTFTGTALCLLRDRGKLDFDEPVRKYVPELPEYDNDNPLRIVNLLQHTSGLPDYTGWPDPPGRHPQYADNEDFVRLLAARPKLVALHFPVGKKYQYSNTNFLLLAVIASRITRKPFGMFMHDEIFKPLGMTHSWIYDRPAAHLRHPTLGDVNAPGYEKDDRGNWEVSWGSPPFRNESILTCGDGSLWTSLEDLILWDKGLREGKLVKPETWAEATTPSKTRNGKTNGYGYGWDLDLDDSGELLSFGHNGSWGGFKTQYNRFPKTDRAVFVLINRGDLSSGDVADAVAEVVDEEMQKVAKANTKQARAKARAEKAKLRQEKKDRKKARDEKAKDNAAGADDQ